ncbi:uncharacterized protein Bfra_012261 [Botrytis fragariae]|uniref:Uncharacterized protein n=1 Tax=Botrytis fragariae TaxID=1964551 RepID=A0A8H6AIY5_9HELO|nr:uncharacterized protein Bfra_012261 [Botrytis fragariae]KAF5868613.1 hypothetical protein Bfra_012261 [Botrytis fragariae]
MSSCIPGNQKEIKSKDFVAGSISEPKTGKFVDDRSEHKGGHAHNVHTRRSEKIPLASFQKDKRCALKQMDQTVPLSVRRRRRQYYLEINFIDACHTIQIPVPTFYRVTSHNKARFVLQVTVLGHRIRSQNSEISCHAAKVQLARRGVHYLQGARNPAPALALGPGSSDASATQNPNLVVSGSRYQFSRITDKLMPKQPASHNVLSAHDQSHLELYFRRHIISQIGSSTRVQVTAAADLMADIILWRSEGQTTEWYEVMRVFTGRLAQRLTEGSS